MSNQVERVEIELPCCCLACDQRLQPGHFTCEGPSPRMLALEQAGKATREYQDGKWRWFMDHGVPLEVHRGA